MKRFLFQLVIIILPVSTLMAQPVAFDYQVINGCKVYKDAKASNVFYYEPFDYRLAVDKNSKPVFTLLQMRYTGTRASADNGRIKFRNILQFKIDRDGSTNDQLQAVKEVLKKRVPSILLKPLPITRFETILVYAPADNADSLLKLLTNGYTEEAGEASSINKSFWSERTFSIRLSDVDAQLMEAALQNKQAAISLSYAFYTSFSAKSASSFSATVNGRVSRKVLDYFDSALINNKDSLLENVLLKADAIPINIDIEKWSTAIQKIDINEKLPSTYPLFDLYCYDFNNAIRPDLYAKKIEIRAISVNGNEINLTSMFLHNKPDEYARSIRFPYAVRFDKPYRYRTTEINMEGETLISDWIHSNSWSDIIDITTKTK